MEQLFPENGIIQAGLFMATDGLSAEAEMLGGTQYTKSSWMLGQEMHKAYKAGDVIEGVAMKEYREIPGIRPDFVDFRTNTIYELKPFNPRGIRLGTKQLNNYKRIFEEKIGGTWNTVLDHY